jgi:membrane-associated protease RseP (regulator of RpoE activity)
MIWIGVVIFVVALLFSIMFHETGHFVTAKMFGMKCTRFFVGMGPTVWSTWRGETEYGIKALPIGGFVKIVGMHSLDDLDDPEDEPRSFRSKPGWQRIIVLSAGSFMHFVLAFAILVGMALTLGIENDNTVQLGTVITCLAPNVTDLNNGTCGDAAHQPSPAAIAGLRVGDQVTSFNGTPVSNWTQLSNVIKAASPGQTVSLTVLRDGKTLHLSTKLAQVKGRKGAYMGIAPAVVFQVASPVGAVSFFGSAVAQEISGSVSAISALPKAVPKLFTKERSDTNAGQIQSMVGVAEDTGQAVEANVGWRPKVAYVLLIIASINIFVGVLNMLPLLPMDGGHVALVLWERIRARFARLRGRPDPGLVDMQKVLPVMFSIFMVIVFFSVVLMIADIVNPVSGGA